jgi:phospholipase C
VDEGARDGRLTLTLVNDGSQAAVFHVYDRLRLDHPPRRFTVEPDNQISDIWPIGAYDLWVLGPNGFHRHFIGAAPGEDPILHVLTSPTTGRVSLTLRNPGHAAKTLAATPNAYKTAFRPWNMTLPPAREGRKDLSIRPTGGWYDMSIEAAGYLRRVAGRVETGVDSISDPAMGGMAIMDQPFRD